MPRFPYMNMPFSYYRNYPRYPYSYNYSSYFTQGNSINTNSKNNNLDNLSKYENQKQRPTQSQNKSSNQNQNLYSNQNSNRNSNQSQNKNKSNSTDSDYLFDLFGIKLYFDDILILGLIYFLYSEGVKDEMLFISLLLLLIS